MALSIPAQKPTFYSKNSGSKKALKAVIRPTFKQKPEVKEELPITGQDPTEIASINFQPFSNLIEKSQTLKRLKEEEIRPSIVQTPEPVEITGNGQDPEIDQLQRLIKEATDKIQTLEQKRIQNQKKETQLDQLDAFNGISSEGESNALFHERINYLQKENQKLKHQMELIKEEFAKEKKQFEKTLRTIKSDNHADNPVTENNFFSFSKELKEAIKAIDNISELPVPMKGSQVVMTAPEIAPPSVSIPVSNIVTPTTAQMIMEPTPPVNIAPPQLPNQVAPVPAKTKGKERKLLITGVALLIILMIGGILSFQLTAKASVDDTLVEEYLNKGQVQGAQTGELSRASKHNNGIVPDKNADVSYEETKWEKIDDYNVGIRLEYPANLVERLHAGTSTTFMRKNSYIFKYQFIDSKLTPEEYLEQRNDKSTYTTTPIKLGSKEGLHIIPSEKLEFPIERYLIKITKGLVEFSFAVPSSNFSDEDFKRIEYMKQSVGYIL